MKQQRAVNVGALDQYNGEGVWKIVHDDMVVDVEMVVVINATTAIVTGSTTVDGIRMPIEGEVNVNKVAVCGYDDNDIVRTVIELIEGN